MNNKQLQKIIEGLLFVYGESGISINDLNQALPDAKTNEIKQAIIDLERKYIDEETSALAIQRYGQGKYRLHTKPELHEYYVRLEEIQKNSRLSASSIEVLSIIAYKSPISKGAIDHIRDSDSSYQVAKLREKNLIRVIGKSETGANQYGITENFFKMFNLSGGIDALPKINNEEIDKLVAQAQENEAKKNEHSKTTNMFAINSANNDNHDDNGFID